MRHLALSNDISGDKGKLLAVIGYGLAAVSKPLFPLAGSAAWIFTARLIDLMGKGIRGAPRDALIGDLAPSELRGACYGLRQSQDTVGAFFSVAILIFAVKEPVISALRSPFYLLCSL